MTSPLVAAGACALGAALVIGVATDPGVLLAAVLLAQAAVVVGWHRCLDVPGATGGRVVAGAAALGSDVLVLADAGDQPLSAVPAVLAMAMLAALVHQLLRQDGRDRLTASLTATVSLAALASLGSTFLAVSEAEDGLGLVSTAATAAALVVAGVSVRRWRGGSHRHHISRDMSVDVAVVAAAGAVAAVAVVALDGLPVVPAIAVAGSAAAISWVASVLAARAPAAAAQRGAWWGAGPSAGLPMLVAGPVAYVLGRLLVG